MVFYMSQALIAKNIDNLDLLSIPETVTVSGRQLREGMILVDPVLGTPKAWIDQRIGVRAGCVRLNLHDLDTDRFLTDMTFRYGGMFQVVAKEN